MGLVRRRKNASKSFKLCEGKQTKINGNEIGLKYKFIFHPLIVRPDPRFVLVGKILFR